MVGQSLVSVLFWQVCVNAVGVCSQLTFFFLPSLSSLQSRIAMWSGKKCLGLMRSQPILGVHDQLKVIVDNARHSFTIHRSRQIPLL